MNQVTPESKNAAIKTLAIIGFIVMIVVALWLAIQIVQLIPNAFTRLANLAEDVNSGARTIVLEDETIVTNADSIVTIAYRGVRGAGTYSFNYACVDKVAVAIIDETGSKEFIACDEAYTLSDARPLELVVASEKERNLDLTYTITFTPTTGEEPITTSGKLTVVNANIPVGGPVAGTNDPTPAEPEPEVPVTTTPTTPRTPTTYTPGKPVTTIKYVTQIPKSNPNGFTDLAISYTSGNTVDAEDDTTITIEVINLGTKTSKDWDLTVELPDGLEYELENEDGLKPNERATITIEFDASDLDGTEIIEAEVRVSDDTKKSNNSFRKTVRFED